MEIRIYQITEGDFDKHICQIVAKMHDISLDRISIICKERTQMLALNTKLWIFSQKDFIPHGTEYDPLEQSKYVLLTTQKNSHSKHNIIADFDWQDFLDIISSFEKNADILSINYCFQSKSADCKKQQQIIKDFLKNSNIETNLKYFLYSDQSWRSIS